MVRHRELRRLILLPLAMALLLAGGCEPGDPTPIELPPTEPPTPQALEQIDLPGLQALIRETAASDRILVIDFWATWCVPCVAMFPELHEQVKALGEQVRMVSVTLDAPGEYEQRAIEFLRTHHALEDAYLLDNEHQVAVVKGLGEHWQDVVVPAILVFDRQGRRVGEFVDESAHIGAIMAKVVDLVHQEAVAVEP